jgi:outer membrane protein TolC
LSRGTAAKERLELIQSKNNSLSKATKDALLLYRNGMASYLEVITTLNNSLQNELDAISVRKEQFDATTELYRSLGGGVE